MPCKRANSLAIFPLAKKSLTQIKKAARGDFDYHVISALLVEAAWIRMLASEDGAVGLRSANPTLYYSLHAVRDIANGIDRCQNLGRHIKTG